MAPWCCCPRSARASCGARRWSSGVCPMREGCALVTGSARGIGAASATALAAEGWPVAVNYRSDADGAEAVAETIREAGGRAETIQADVRDPAAIAELFKDLEERFAPVLVVVN